MFASLLHALAHQVESRPNKVALIVPDGSQTQAFTWHQLSHQVCTQAAKLEHLLHDGNAPRCVGYASDNSLGDVLTALACPLIGAMEIPVDHRLGLQARKLASSIGGVWLDSHHSNRDEANFAGGPLKRIQTVLPKITADANALILWTSGTTAEPKAVTLTNQNLIGNALAKWQAVPNVADDIRLTSLPLCHAYARTSDLGTWLVSGCTLAIGVGFDAWQTLGPQVRPTIANVVPRLAKRLSESDTDHVGLDRLRLLGCGGAAMPERDFQTWKDRGVTVIQGYGLTESSPVICSATPENATAGLVGQFVDGWEHEIRDGRLFVRGPHVMAGYYGDVDATQQKIIGGWLDTGDLVEIDSATGQLRILGRADDVIVLQNGHKIHPASIERQIEQIECVKHALIVQEKETIELWLDAQPSAEHASLIQTVLNDRPKWEHPTAVHYFREPLRAANGELTAKGTIRREQLIKRIR